MAAHALVSADIRQVASALLRAEHVGWDGLPVAVLGQWGLTNMGAIENLFGGGDDPKRCRHGLTKDCPACMGDEIADLRKANELLHALIGNRENDLESARKALGESRAAMLRTRTASIAGCEEGYGKPEKWADELFASHGSLTAAIKSIDALLAQIRT